MRTKLFITFFLFIAMLPVYAQKIACVDMGKVSENSTEVAAEKKKMEEMYKQSRKKLETKQNELMKLQEKLKKEGSTASTDAQRAMGEEYQRQLMELQQMAQEEEKKLADKEAKTYSDFIEKVKKIAMKIAIQKGYDLVLAKEQLLYIDDKLDITKFVTAEINK
ncbi:MAG: OmpH family outer membrane protein [bacterium]